jgi:uncharacterized protein YgiM (DUF1202 family)
MRKLRNLRGNVLVLFVLAAFLFLGIFGEAGKAQMMRSTKPTPTPKKASTPKGMAPRRTPASTRPTPKPTAKTTPKPTPKPADTPQIIISATSTRLRSGPSTTTETVQYLKIGAVYPVLDKNTQWYKVQVGEKSGWVSNTVSQTFSSAKRGETYQAIAAKYFKQQSMDFATASQLYDFLTLAEKQVTNRKQLADLSYKRLLALEAALKKIPMDKQGSEPYKAFLKGKDKEIIYSDPSAEYYVISSLFWELHEKYKDMPVGEEIAWTAALNPQGGECEGYINCYLYVLRSTHGEYLNFYPAGKYSKKALADIGGYLEPIAADSSEKSVYTGPADISDRADFNKYLTELRTIISKVPYAEKAKPLAQIKQLGEAYR